MSRINRENRGASEAILENHKDDLRLLGAALNAIYQAATCHRKCWNTGHVLEMMGARIYNLACAAYSLICIGFYDEALNLTRSVGEIANLIVLSTVDKELFGEWIKSTKRERINKFGPGKVRGLLKKKEALVLMDSQWYSDLCEDYTHITAGVKPNFHETLKRSICGGMIHEAGTKKSLEQLTHIIGLVALFYCRYFDFDDLFAELTTLVKSAHSAAKHPMNSPT